MEPNSEIKIEKGVPLPKRRASNCKYPFRSMKVGDSFFVPGYRIRSGLYHLARAQGIEVSVRLVDGGHRVWRVK